MSAYKDHISTNLRCGRTLNRGTSKGIRLRKFDNIINRVSVVYISPMITSMKSTHESIFVTSLCYM